MLCMRVQLSILILRNTRERGVFLNVITENIVQHYTRQKQIKKNYIKIYKQEVKQKW